jgi:glycosyltransferase involved in cell wall biosynthesis
MRERIRTILKRESIDMVHVDMLPLSVYVDEFMNKPKVIVNHNVESIRLYRWYEAERNLIKRQYLRMQWLRLRSFERTALERFESCIAVSETDRHALEGMGIRTRMFVVPNGTDTRYFVPSTKEPVADRVLWFGHMDVHTNRDAVLYFWREICPILRTRHPQTELMFVGTKPPKEIADAGKWDPRIRTTGFVDDIRPHVQGSAVVVVPIRIGSGTRLKILDAMAMGKAIVSTSVGSEGLDVTDTKDICIADDPHSFAEKTIMLIKNAAFRRTLERNARQLALSYDWSRMGAEQERAYDHAVTRWSCIGRLMGREKGIGCGREGEREVQRCEREFC